MVLDKLSADEKIRDKIKSNQRLQYRKHLNQYDVIHLDIQWCMEPAGGAEQVVLQS